MQMQHNENVLNSSLPYDILYFLIFDDKGLASIAMQIHINDLLMIMVRFITAHRTVLQTVIVTIRCKKIRKDKIS